MQRVIGLGGVFFQAKDPKMLREWYRKHLGMEIQDWGAMLNTDRTGDAASVTWQAFAQDDAYFSPARSPFMINYRVADLHALLQVLREEGCQVLDKVEESDFGKFGWVMDPEGNKIELWEAPTEGQ